MSDNTLLSLRSRIISARHNDGTKHEHKVLTEDEVNLSISNIAAQLLSNPPEGSVASDNVENPNYEPHTENQAKVVDHIKGLLNDIVTNTLVDGETDDKLFVVNMQSDDEKNAKPTENTPFTPTILQTMYSLDSNTIKDKETIVKIINSMKANEKAVEGDIKEATTYVSIFETTAKPEEENMEENETTEKLMVDGDILGQYIAAYDANTEDESAAVKSASTSTTTTTSTTKSTTASTTTRTTTSTTTSTTTTTTPVPTLIERAGNFVSGGIGGIVNGLANVQNILSAATQPFWLPLGRKRRETGEEIDREKFFQRFRAFKKTLRQMDQERLDEIIRGVVKKVMQKGDNVDIEGLDSELMTRHISKILLNQNNISSKASMTGSPDSSVSVNDL